MEVSPSSAAQRPGVDASVSVEQARQTLPRLLYERLRAAYESGAPVKRFHLLKPSPTEPAEQTEQATDAW